MYKLTGDVDLPVETKQTTTGDGGWSLTGKKYTSCSRHKTSCWELLKIIVEYI